MERSHGKSLTAAVIVLTTGDRESDLLALDRSLAESLSDDVEIERLLVANTDRIVQLAGWRVVSDGVNHGIPGGRNLGAKLASADILIFIDDDAVVRTRGLVEQCLVRFDRDEKLGALGFRLVVTGTDHTLRRWNPRIGNRKVAQPGAVTAFAGGASAIRKSALDGVGGFCADFFYALEETDLSWRLLDNGWGVSYVPTLILEHPEATIERHTGALRHTARNRVWLARRSLPHPISAMYVASWFVWTLATFRSAAAWRALRQGTADGLGRLPGTRTPMRWSTVWAMTKLGRPPLV